MAKLRKLGRATANRKAMLRGMVTYLVEHGRIETTVTRAKEVSSLAEKMITAGKAAHAGDYKSVRKINSFITVDGVARKLVNEVAPEYAERNGGYTRITRIGPRRGDGAEMAVIELIK